MASPCGGCPPCCPQCVFAPEGEAQSQIEVAVPATTYGCVKGFGDIVTDPGGRLGQMRDGKLHLVTPRGAAFLRETSNPLATYLD